MQVQTSFLRYRFVEWNPLKDHKRSFLHQLTCDEHERSVIFFRESAEDIFFFFLQNYERLLGV